MITHSSGGLLMTTSPLQDQTSSTMPDHSPVPSDGTGPNRRSTSTSDALQYYWSSSAGERSNSISSNLGVSTLDSSPRLALGSPYTLSPHPQLREARSQMSVGEFALTDDREELVGVGSSTDMSMSAFADGIHDSEGVSFLTGHRDGRERTHSDASDPGPSNRRIHLVSYSTDSVSGLVSEQSNSSLNRSTPPSPGATSMSGDSEYSLEDETIQIPMSSAPEAPQQRTQEEEAALHLLHRHGGVIETDGNLQVLVDQTFDSWSNPEWDKEDGGQAAIPSPVPLASAASAQDAWRTPTLPPIDRSRISPVDWPTRTPTPGYHPSPGSQASATHTPRGDPGPRPLTRHRNNAMSPRTVQIPKSSGRLLFVAAPDVSRQSIDALERESHSSDLHDLNGVGVPGRRIDISVGGPLNEFGHPRSAPPSKTSFNPEEISGEGPGAADKRRVMSLQPPAKPVQHPPSEEEATPLAVPRRSPRRSPEPHPRSPARLLSTSPPARGVILEDPAIIAEPEPISPLSPGSQVPTIIHTAHTPTASPQARKRGSNDAARYGPPSTPSHSRSSPRASPPAPAIAQSTTLKDLTNLLSGAIDDIGLMDSRETPPPSIGIPPKVAPSVRGRLDSAPFLSAPATRSSSQGSGSPTTSLPAQPHPLDRTKSSSPPLPGLPAAPVAASTQRPSPLSHIAGGNGSAVGLGLVGGMGTNAGISGGLKSSRPGHVRKASSILSLRSSSTSLSPTVPTFAASSGQTLPTAVLFGNVKQLRTPGERARQYARQITELGRADSGLKEWCTSINISQRQPKIAVNKQAAMSALGMGQSGSMLSLPEPTPRVISGASEFVMRPDAYAAREISVRNMDPFDAPTALPPNLPYPQLQATSTSHAHVRSSASMQSIASVQSTASRSGRTGFFSAVGRALKKEKESTSLGPPNPGVNGVSSPHPKRDLRHSPIPGSPAYSPGRENRASLDSVGETPPAPNGPRQPHSSPLGPRGQRERELGLPGRASLDMPPRPHMSQAPRRESLDSPRGSLLHPRGGPSSVSSHHRTLSPLARSESRDPMASTASLGSSSLASVSVSIPMSANPSPSPISPTGSASKRGSRPGSTPSTPAVAMDEDVSKLCEYIPQADRAVAKAYVARYGGWAEAMSAYFDDEKRGTLLSPSLI